MRLDVWQDLLRDRAEGVQPDGETWAACLDAGRQVLLPIRTLPDGARGVASLILNQASFVVLDALADRLAEGLAQHAPQVILGVPTLGLPLAEAVARRLGHRRMVPLGISAKFWYDEALSVPVRSITSPGAEKRLYLDPRMLELLRGRRVAVVDDVLSSGTSIAAVLDLLRLVDVTPAAIGAAMVQGSAWQARTGAAAVLWSLATPILRRTEAGWRPE